MCLGWEISRHLVAEISLESCSSFNVHRCTGSPSPFVGLSCAVCSVSPLRQPWPHAAVVVTRRPHPPNPPSNPCRPLCRSSSGRCFTCAPIDELRCCWSTRARRTAFGSWPRGHASQWRWHRGAHRGAHRRTQPRADPEPDVCTGCAGDGRAVIGARLRRRLRPKMVAALGQDYLPSTTSCRVGRTSMVASGALGILAASWTASFMSRASTR